MKKKTARTRGRQTPQKKKSTGKKVVRKQVVKKKSAKKTASTSKSRKSGTRKNAPRVKTAVKKSPKKKAQGKKAAKRKSTARSKTTPVMKKRKRAAKSSKLGRVKVTGNEKLFLLFKEDYHARQIFDFLRVQTVRELEQLTPDKIVERLSAPIRHTVTRIRCKLALANRHLHDDREFAIQFQQRDRKS
jgi:hypothetical protein